MCSSHEYKIKSQTYTDRRTNTFDARQIYSGTYISFDVGIFCSLVDGATQWNWNAIGQSTNENVLWIIQNFNKKIKSLLYGR